MSATPSFFAELQRRHVYKVGAMYAVAGWLLVQVATQVFPFFDVPNSAVRWTILIIVAGFPVALVLAWLFDITPQGIVRTADAAALDQSPETIGVRRGMDRKLNYLLGGMVIIGIGYFIAERTVLSTLHESAGADLQADKSIAVLPFENLSDEQANAYFASGIQDEILTRLSGIGDLKVISRTSTEKYKSRPDNLKTVALELGVATLLEGSVQKSGERVRVNVQLIQASTDTHLWAKTYDRELKDAFAVESEVSQAIADALKAQLSAGEVSALAKSPTDNVAAYDLFLKAEYEAQLASDSGLEADYRHAEDRYRQALKLDPGFALAQARLAYLQLLRHWLVKPLEPEKLAAVKQTIDRALALAPKLADAQLALGYYDFWAHRDYEPAQLAFRRALELEPNNANALAALAFIDRRQGHSAQALAGLAKAISFAPRDSGLLGEYASTLELMGRYEEARQAFDRSLAVDPAKMDSLSFLTRAYLFGFGDASGALHLFDGIPLDRMAPINNDDGDVINLVNTRVYPYLFQRRYDEALQAWDVVAATTEAQRIDKLSARVAIQTLAGRRALGQMDCKQLLGLLEAQLAKAPEALPILTRLSWAYTCLGRKADAIRSATRAADLLPLSIDAYSGNYFLNGLAQIDAQNGEPESALNLIAKLLSMPAGDTLSIQRLKLDPVWDPLRSDARFHKLTGD